MKHEIADRFFHHPPTTQEVEDAHKSIRSGCQNLAERLDKLCPDGREKALAMTKLEEVMFWANASVARTQLKIIVGNKPPGLPSEPRIPEKDVEVG